MGSLVVRVEGDSIVLISFDKKYFLFRKREKFVATCAERPLGRVIWQVIIERLAQCLFNEMLTKQFCYKYLFYIVYKY